MIRLTCDNCEKHLEVGDELAGQKVKCPACGDVNVVPGAAPVVAAAKTPDRAAAAGYPAADAPEVLVLRVRRAMFRAKPASFTVLLLGLVGGAGAAVFFLLASPISLPLVGVCAGVAVLCLIVLGVWRITTIGEAMQISNKRTIERTGVFAKSTSEVMHRDIRNIQIHQTFRDRIFGVGRIVISSSAEEDSEIVASDIPSPGKVRDIIDLYRKV
jgi:phage FluMu protein Com